MPIKYLLLLGLTISCGNSTQNFIDSEDVVKITIGNHTNNRRSIANKLILTDVSTLHKIINELNNMKPINNAAIKYNFGYFDLWIEFKNKSPKWFTINYTEYDGVVIVESDGSGILMNQLYKNDKLENLIISLVQP